MTIVVLCFILAVTNPLKSCNCLKQIQNTVSLEVDFPDGKKIYIESIPWIQNETVSLAMGNAKCFKPDFTYETAYYCPYGRLITDIMGMVPTQNRQYWVLYINGKLSEFGMDTTLLKPKDKIRWVIEDAPH